MLYSSNITDFKKIQKGESPIVFNIRTPNGTSFTEDITQIELQTEARNGNDLIVGSEYVWSYYDTSNKNWIEISRGVSSSLTVAKDSTLVSSTIECKMIYDEQSYTAYVSLTNQSTLYTSTIKFFSGSNIFPQKESYLIAYNEIYKNKELVDEIKTNKYHFGNITDTLDTTLADGQYMYFIYDKDNDSNLEAVLYQYNEADNDNETTKGWTLVEDEFSYAYLWNASTNRSSNTSKIFIISKNDISRSDTIECNVYKNVLNKDGEQDYGNDYLIARTSANVIDLNDPIVSSIQPENARAGQMWVDTSGASCILWIYTINNGTGEWIKQQDGGTVYTYKPSRYIAGDLWVLNSDDAQNCFLLTETEGETPKGKYTEGTMLKAISDSTMFSEKDWKDAMSNVSDAVSTVLQCFKFDSNNGLQIKQSDGNFYVQIKATSMDFHAINGNIDTVAVRVGTNYTEIRNTKLLEKTTVEGDASFTGSASFDKQINMYKSGTSIGFTWKVESDGSLSLVLSS